MMASNPDKRLIGFTKGSNELFEVFYNPCRDEYVYHNYSTDFVKFFGWRTGLQKFLASVSDDAVGKILKNEMGVFSTTVDASQAKGLSDELSGTYNIYTPTEHVAMLRSLQLTDERVEIPSRLLKALRSCFDTTEERNKFLCHMRRKVKEGGHSNVYFDVGDNLGLMRSFLSTFYGQAFVTMVDSNSILENRNFMTSACYVLINGDYDQAILDEMRSTDKVTISYKRATFDYTHRVTFIVGKVANDKNIYQLTKYYPDFVKYLLQYVPNLSDEEYNAS